MRNILWVPRKRRTSEIKSPVLMMELFVGFQRRDVRIIIRNFVILMFYALGIHEQAHRAGLKPTTTSSVTKNLTYFFSFVATSSVITSSRFVPIIQSHNLLPCCQDRRKNTKHITDQSLKKLTNLCSMFHIKSLTHILWLFGSLPLFSTSSVVLFSSPDHEMCEQC